MIKSNVKNNIFKSLGIGSEIALGKPYTHSFRLKKRIIKSEINIQFGGTFKILKVLNSKYNKRNQTLTIDVEVQK